MSAQAPALPRRHVGRRRLIRIGVALIGLYALWTLAINIPGGATDGAVAYSFAYATDSRETACTSERQLKRLCTVTLPGDSVEVSAVYEVTRDGRCWTAKLRPGPRDSYRWPESPHGCIVLSDNLRLDNRAFGDHEVRLREDDSRFSGR